MQQRNGYSILGYGCMRFTRNGDTIDFDKAEKEIYGTAHNSILKDPKKDLWYIVYHRINPTFRGRRNGPGIHRQVCIDPLTFDKSGKIIPVEPTK